MKITPTSTTTLMENVLTATTSESGVEIATPSPATFECGGKNEAYDFARFALVTYVGTPIALLGLLFNAFLVVSISFKTGVVFTY